MARRPVNELPSVPLQHPLWERLLPYGHMRRLAPGVVLYRQGERASSCFYIHRGRVKAVVLRPDGAEKILEVMGPGALLGEAAAFDGLPHYSSCITLDPSDIYAFSVPQLLAAVQADPEVALFLLQVMSRKQRVLAGQVEDMAFLDTTGRVVHLLLRLAADYGVGPPAERRLGLRLTHEQIASMAGCSRIAVTRALGRLRSEGAVGAAAGGCLTVCVPRLQQCAGLDLPVRFGGSADHI